MNKLDTTLTKVRKMLGNGIIILFLVVFLPSILLLVFGELLEKYLSKDNRNMILILLVIPTGLVQFYWIMFLVTGVLILLGCK